MRGLKCVGAAAVLLLFSGSAVAQEAKSEEKVVCRTQDDTTSRIGRKRICRSVSEWKQQDESVRQDATKAFGDTTRRNRAR